MHIAPTTTHYANVTFIKGGRWLQTRTAVPIVAYASTWITELNGEVVLASSLKQINDIIEQDQDQ